MALNIHFQINQDFLQNNAAIFEQQFVIMTPQQIYNRFPFVDYEYFRNILNLSPFFPYNNDNQGEFHIKHYYIRYLIACGRFEYASEFILRLVVYNVNNINEFQNVQEIINYRHESFLRSSLFHFAVNWGAPQGFLLWLINHGADMNSRDVFGNLAGHRLHLSPWSNPFAPFFNMDHIFNIGNRIGVRSEIHFHLDWFNQYFEEEGDEDEGDAVNNEDIDDEAMNNEEVDDEVMNDDNINANMNNYNYVMDAIDDFNNNEGYGDLMV